MAQQVGRRESGATAVEYAGLVVLAGALAALITFAIAPSYVSAQVSYGVCVITGGTSCVPPVPPSDSQNKPPSNPQDGARDWYAEATRGSAWMGGDSFAAGEGAGDYEPGTDQSKSWWPWDDTKQNKCHRSTNSYQAQVFRILQSRGAFAGETYHSNACSGSTVPNLYSQNQQGNDEGPQAQNNPGNGGPEEQFDKIPDDASLITMSLGGNDVGFADILKNCITGVMGTGCNDSALVQSRLNDTYGAGDGHDGTLEAQIRKMRQQHPNARIIIMGYPQLLTETKGAAPGLSVKEQRWINEQSVAINASIKAMCKRQGVEFIDPTDLFVGTNPDGSHYDHRIGSSDSWFYRSDWSTYTGQSAFHPNRSGHDAMATRLLQQIQNGPRG